MVGYLKSSRRSAEEIATYHRAAVLADIERLDGSANRQDLRAALAVRGYFLTAMVRMERDWSEEDWRETPMEGMAEDPDFTFAEAAFAEVSGPVADVCRRIVAITDSLMAKCAANEAVVRRLGGRQIEISS